MTDESNIPGYDVQFDANDKTDGILMHYISTILGPTINLSIDQTSRQIIEQINGHPNLQSISLESTIRRQLRYALGLYLLETASSYNNGYEEGEALSPRRNVARWVETKIINRDE